MGGIRGGPAGGAAGADGRFEAETSAGSEHRARGAEDAEQTESQGQCECQCECEQCDDDPE